MRKGIFIPGISVEMFRNASLEAVEEFMCSGQMEDIEIPERPHGTWVDVPKYKGFYVCSKCLERLDGDFDRFDHWEMKKENFCSVCGSDNRKMGDQNET